MGLRMRLYYLGENKMNYYDDKKIIPYIGIDDIKFGMKLSDVTNILKKHEIKYCIGISPNKGYEKEIPWETIYIKDYMSLVFANNILWQINFEENFPGKLENGIKIGTKVKDLKKYDNTIFFDDWNENWESKKGYWLFDTVESGKIYMFSIFIKECLNDDEFYSYEWLKKYEK